jgi:hypothetical protein
MGAREENLLQGVVGKRWCLASNNNPQERLFLFIAISSRKPALTSSGSQGHLCSPHA